MNRRSWSLLGGLVIAGIALLILAPRSNYQPGALLAAHQQLGSDCASCHRAWHGPSSQGCVNCHGDLGDSNVHSGVDVTQEEVGLIAGHTLRMSRTDSFECLSCHSEHQGAAVDVKATAAFACTWCHKHPAIERVSGHMVPVMQRKTFVRHVFKRPFNHHQHKLLIEQHNPAAGVGLNCESCHLVPPVKPAAHEQMRLKWSGCGGSGCHDSPQDRYMQMPAAAGRSPVTIAYSGAIPIRHLKAVFLHSSGHLQSACTECHFKVAASITPDDGASLAIRQCFNCHAHQQSKGLRTADRGIHPNPLPQVDGQAPDTSTQGVAYNLIVLAYASGVTLPSPRTVIACGDCHLFHSNGVVPILDFPNPAPNFPPNERRLFAVGVYVPQLHHRAGGVQLGPIAMRPVIFSPWWLGLLAIGLVGYGFAHHWRQLPAKQLAQEAVAGVAPQRSKEVPALDDTYQTNIRHLYIIGEAAGTASINLAMRSGRQVIEAIVNDLGHPARPLRPELHDVLIVGCGPAGLGATVTAKVSGLKYATLEKLTPASTLRSYPRAKFVQATPIDIEEYGSFFLEGDNSREELIKEWEKIIARLGLVINDREEVVDIVREQDNFVVKTARGNSYVTRCVVLAIGVRGNPRHLNLEGEVAGRVFYTLIEPGEFSGRKILVVGGGNAGAEVVQALAAPRLGNRVTYSFRSPVLANVTRENADSVVALQQSKTITIYPATALTQIRPRSVVLEPVKSGARGADGQAGIEQPTEIENDVIFAMIGAELPAAFLKTIGVRMVSKSRMYG
jgi:thioredoxin reductase (NADPH)